MSVRILITRPEEDATRTVAAIEARGHVALSIPLTRIAFAPRPPSLKGVAAVLATSGNGVRALARLSKRRDLKLFVTGEASAEIARELGFKNVEAGGGDGQSALDRLMQRIKPDAGAILHVRGTAVAGDPAASLTQAGYTIHESVLYTVEPIEPPPERLAEALRRSDIDAALFFSSAQASTFASLAIGAGLSEECRRVHALALSEAVAEALSPVPFAAIWVADRPDLASLLDRLDRGLAGLRGEGAPSAGDEGAGRSWNMDEKKPDDDKAGPAVLIEHEPVRDSGTAHDDTPTDMLEAAPAESAARRARQMTIAVAAALLLALIFATLPWWRPALPEGIARVLPGPEDLGPAIRAMRADVAVLEGEVRTLRAQLDDLRNIVVELPRNGGAADVGPALAPLREDLAGLRADLKALSDRIQSLEARPPVEAAAPAPTVDPGRVDALAEQLAAVNQRVERLGNRPDPAEAAARVEGQLSERLKALEAELAQARADTTARGAGIAALSLLHSAVVTGRPFETQLRAARETAPPASRKALEPLVTLSGAQVPTLAGLTRAYIAIEPEIVRVAALPEGDGLGARTLRRLSSVVSVTRTDGAAETTPAALAAAVRERLGRGDLAGAVELAGRFEGAAASQVAPWIAEARRRLTAEQAVDQALSAGLGGGVAP